VKDVQLNTFTVYNSKSEAAIIFGVSLRRLSRWAEEVPVKEHTIKKENKTYWVEYVK
jgi:phage terminase Nu1 subunit (DNA packaging protein)